MLPIWERATGLQYFKYRAAIRKACENALRELGIPLTIGADKVDWGGDDEALIAIDDDDILLPSVVSVGERITPDINLVIWQRVTNYLGRERLENPSYGAELDTCNWAIRKSFLLNYAPGVRHHILSKHWHAVGLMADRLGMKTKPRTLLEKAKHSVVLTSGHALEHPSILRLIERHSVYYLHSASISFLTNKIAKVGNPVDFIKTLPLHPLYNHVPC